MLFLGGASAPVAGFLKAVCGVKRARPSVRMPLAQYHLQVTDALCSSNSFAALNETHKAAEEHELHYVCDFRHPAMQDDPK